MRQTGLQGAFMRKRRRCSTRRDPAATPAPDLVNRNFNSDPPDRLWVADISRIPTGEGALWLASVRDAFSRRVVGWKASDRADTELVLGALEYALWSRKVDPYAHLIDAWLRAQPKLKASVIWERLVTEHGFDGHYQRVKVYVRENRARLTNGLPPIPRRVGYLAPAGEARVPEDSRV